MPSSRSVASSAEMGRSSRRLPTRRAVEISAWPRSPRRTPQRNSRSPSRLVPRSPSDSSTWACAHPGSRARPGRTGEGFGGGRGYSRCTRPPTL
ncbi:hypothetical protein ACFPRL_24095 [Pseudoclavibacter helvolus]